MEAHWQMFAHVVDGDGESLASRPEFYRKHKAVMDKPAEYYAHTISAVFQDHLLPRGLFMSRNRRVSCAAITRTALLTVEGKCDDISDIGQTCAAHHLCTGLPEARRVHIGRQNVGHDGRCNGSRFRNKIAPRIKASMRAPSA